MKAKTSGSGKNLTPPALKALRRAAKRAIELARATGTHAYVLENGRIVDIAKRKPPAKRKRTKRHRSTDKK